ncbi:MAG: cyclic nucleotide-binding domain-containing protein [Proteobacteria bacterium]|nr:cyclic nucleotide-binding domain-containing protein [Pseudomonadota bacterium]
MNEKDKEKFTRRVFPKGAVILKEGEMGDSVFIIVEGKVEIRMGGEENPKTLATRSRGDVIGELALFDNHPHMASAVAIEETVVTTMTKKEFLPRVEEMDPAMRGIVMLLVKRTREMADDLLKSDRDINWAKWRPIK